MSGGNPVVLPPHHLQQFVQTPPRAMVEALFEAMTGHPCRVGVTWREWVPVAPGALEVFRPYIRPCHQRLLNNAVTAGTAAATTTAIVAFMRQLLRPHRLQIDAATRRGPWTLIPEGGRVPIVHQYQSDRTISFGCGPEAKAEASAL